MTSAGKLVVGSIILTASVLTAKWLHKPTVDAAPTLEPAATAPKLHWRSTAGGMQSSGAPAPIEAGGSAIQLTQLTSLDAPRYEATTPAIASLAVNSSGAENISYAPTRPLVPFAVSPIPEPISSLVAVDPVEADEPPIDPSETLHHTVQFGETLPVIAQRYTGRRDRYMEIYEANLDVLSSPADVSPGMVLRIPVR